MADNDEQLERMHQGFADYCESLIEKSLAGEPMSAAELGIVEKYLSRNPITSTKTAREILKRVTGEDGFYPFEKRDLLN